MWVCDSGNNRVLRFNNPGTNSAVASEELGQQPGQNAFTTRHSGSNSSSFNFSNSISTLSLQFGYVEIDNSGRLYVSDCGNGRVLIFNNASSKSNGAAADNVLGQSSTGSESGFPGVSQNQFYTDGYSDWTVYGVTIDNTNNKLIVADGDNGRTLVFSAASALPVQLNSFTAEAANNIVKLNWTTATEVNNYGFNVERSTTPLNPPPYQGGGQGGGSPTGLSASWETLGFVQGHGNSNSPKEYSFTDTPLGGISFQYRLKQIDTDGKYSYSGLVTAELTSPSSFSVKQNYPNPFNPATVISYQLPAAGSVTLKVYDILGKEVATLVNEEESAGNYKVTFNGSNLSSGVYFYQLRSGSLTDTKKLILMK